MPLVRIDVIEGRTPEELRLLAGCVHQALVEMFAAPERDRYQVIQEHSPEHLILLDTGLGIHRSDKVVLVQIIQQGRDEAQKTALYARLAELFEWRRGLQRPGCLGGREHAGRLVIRLRPSAVPHGRALRNRAVHR